MHTSSSHKLTKMKFTNTAIFSLVFTSVALLQESQSSVRQLAHSAFHQSIIMSKCLNHRDLHQSLLLLDSRFHNVYQDRYEKESFSQNCTNGWLLFWPILIFIILGWDFHWDFHWIPYVSSVSNTTT